MRLLLDTHIWLWSLTEPRRLSAKVLRELKAPANELWLSPVTLWEILVLAGKKRVELDGGAHAWVREALQRGPFREAPFTHEVALATAEIQLPHRDPADKFLAATARAFDLTLVTADHNLAAGEGFALLVNR